MHHSKWGTVWKLSLWFNRRLCEGDASAHHYEGLPSVLSSRLRGTCERCVPSAVGQLRSRVKEHSGVRLVCSLVAWHRLARGNTSQIFRPWHRLVRSFVHGWRLKRSSRSRDVWCQQRSSQLEDMSVFRSSFRSSLNTEDGFSQEPLRVRCRKLQTTRWRVCAGNTSAWRKARPARRIPHAARAAAAAAACQLVARTRLPQ